MTYTRTNKKPPEGERCDTMTGEGIRLKRCDNPATVELKGGLPFETWVCEPCAKALLVK